MEAFAFFNGKFVPLSEARVGIMTHALNYGTGVFEGIRCYWSAEEGRFCLFRMGDHYHRIHNSARILKIDIPYSAEELSQKTVDLVKMNPYREDIYVRPVAYKSSEVVGVRLHGLEDGFFIFVAPFGAYLETEKGIRCCVSSWRRIDDNMIPARAKVIGAYVNSAFAKTEAVDNGFDEAIMLTQAGHVSEGSAENIFLIMGGKLVTPPVTENILVGITRDTIMQLARDELGVETIERPIDRSELYLAEECFLCGTGGEVAPVVEIDNRKIGTGQIGTLTSKLQTMYFSICRGRNPKYERWYTLVYPGPITSR